MNIAPVFIGTLNRSDLFKQTVESLKINDLASDTHLFVALDHPARDEHVVGYAITAEFLDTLTGFKDLTVIKRPVNLGAARNFKEGKEFVFKYYNKLITTEDDNYFSPNFLAFMNAGLARFETNPRVFGICGHNYPISLNGTYSGNYYAWQGASVWGFGIWRDRYKTLVYKPEDIRAFINNPLNLIGAYRVAPHLIASLLAKTYAKGDFDAFSDAVICLHLQKEHQYCIFPTLSKVRNFGHDGSGVSGVAIQGISPFATQKIDDGRGFEFIGDEDKLFGNKSVNKILFRYFYRGSIQSIRTLWALVKYYKQNFAHAIHRYNRHHRPL